jgi:hypothetical protein
MIHKFYETLHSAEEYSFEGNGSGGSPCEDEEKEMAVMNKILSSLEDFVRDVSSLDSSSSNSNNGKGGDSQTHQTR